MQQNDQKIKIRPPQYQKYREGVVCSKILPSHFLTLIVGRPGCGKSHLLYEMLTNENLYYKKFNFIFYVTPSKIGDIELNPQFSTKKFDLKWIYQKINEINEQIKQRIKEKKNIGTINVLFVFDDIVGELQKVRLDSMFTSLIYNRRHLIINGTVSIIITSQYYKAIPRLTRANATSVIIYDIIPEDFKVIQREVIYCKDANFIYQIAEKIFASKFKFLYIRLDNGDIMSNFDKKIYTADEDEKKLIPDKLRAIEHEGEDLSDYESDSQQKNKNKRKLQFSSNDEEFPQETGQKVYLRKQQKHSYDESDDEQENKVKQKKEYHKSEILKSLYKKYGIDD